MPNLQSLFTGNHCCIKIIILFLTIIQLFPGYLTFQCLPTQKNCKCEHGSPLNGKNTLHLTCEELPKSSFFLKELSDLILSTPEKKSILYSLNVSRAANFSLPPLLDFAQKHLRDDLRQITLADNNITSSERLNFSQFRHLEHIDLSHNNLTEVHCSWWNSSSLQHLDLSVNLITQFHCENFFASFGQLTYINLANNSLSTVPFKEDVRLPPNIKEIHLAYNFWKCDEEMLEFIDTVAENSQEIFANPTEIRCLEPIARRDISFEQASAVFKRDSICSLCSCYPIEGRVGSLEVDCSARNFTQMPAFLPPNTKVVHLDYNEIDSLQVQPNSSGWSTVLTLSVTHNRIASLQELDATLESLLTLRLASNQLTDIPLHVLERLQELTLGGNPWDCDCNTVSFQKWLRTQSRADLDRIRCADDRYVQPIYQIPLSVLCPQPNRSVELVDIINVTFTLLTAIILLKMVYDYFWQKRTGRLPQFFKINV